MFFLKLNRIKIYLIPDIQVADELFGKSNNQETQQDNCLVLVTLKMHFEKNFGEDEVKNVFFKLIYSTFG